MTENRVLTVSSTATVGVLTVHDEQVPVDEVNELPMLPVPTGKLADGLPVRDDGAVEAPLCS